MTDFLAHDGSFAVATKTRTSGAVGVLAPLSERGLSGEDDVALLARAQGGDNSALATLLERHRVGVERVCRSRLRDPGLAEDAVQETLVRACQRFREFQGGEHFSRWLRRIAKNHCIDVLRAKRRRPADVSVQACADSVDQTASAQVDAVLDVLAFESMMALLRPRDAALLVGRYVHGNSLSELAAEHGLTYKSARVALHRALGRARHAVERHGLVALFPFPPVRRLMAAVTRLAQRHPDAALTLSNIASPAAIAVAVAIAAGTPAFDRPAAPVAGPVPHRVVVTDDLRPDAATAVTRRDTSPAVEAREDAALAKHGPDPTGAPGFGGPAARPVVVGPVDLPATGRQVSQEPPAGSPDQSVGVRPPVGPPLVWESYDDPQMAPVEDAGCAVAQLAAPVTYCER